VDVERKTAALTARFHPLSADRRPPRVRVLEHDPDLGQGLDEAQWRAALATATAPLFLHERGPWRFFPAPEPGSLGALVLRGTILLTIGVHGRGHVEVLGAGDVISPWVGDDAELSLPTVVAAHAISELRLALLEREFTRRSAPWPEIHAALLRRVISRTRRLALQSAINSLPRIEDRVELTLWQLAHRFGRVTPAGFSFQLRLTHSQLAGMVAAQRPSVSVALARLNDAGRVRRGGRDQWLLPGPFPATLADLVAQSGLPPGPWRTCDPSSLVGLDRS